LCGRDRHAEKALDTDTVNEQFLTPHLSIIISAGEHLPLLEHCLRSLATQSLSPAHYEVVLVTDGGVAEPIRRLALSYSLKVIEEPYRDSALARNRAAREAQGRVLLFLDGESKTAPRLLEAHWNAHQDSDRVVVLGYRPTPALQANGTPFAEREHSDQHFEELSKPSHRFMCLDFSSGNVSLTAALFHAVGGFDERMTAGAEDYDIAARLLKQGARFQFTAEALCVRQVEATSEQSRARGAAEGAAFAALVEKHIDLFWKFLYNFDALERTPGRWEPSLYTERENAYWEAVRAQLGSFGRWEDLFEDAPLVPKPQREIEIALPDDLPRLDEIFAAQHVDSVLVSCGGAPLGRIDPQPGEGALSGACVREQLESRFSHVLLGLLVAQRSRTKDSGAAVAGERFTGAQTAIAGAAPAEEPFSWSPAAMVNTRIAEFDLARPTHIWGLEGATALYLLVRNNGQPIAIHRSWISNQRALSKREVLNMIGMAASPALPAIDRGSDLPPISVVVCTRNRPHALKRCLDALLRSRYPQFEVVVIDYGPEREEIAERVASPAVRVINATAPGIESARNRGAAESWHDVIAYVDETAVVDPDWLAAIGSAFKEPGIDAVTGLVLPAELLYPAQHIYEQFGPAPRNLVRTIFDDSRKPVRDKIATHEVGTGANMAFRRSALTRTGGFNTEFERIAVRRTCGELDLFHRILTAGMKICYEPAALVWQRYPRTERRQLQEFREWRRGFGMYLLNLFAAARIPRRAVLEYAWREWLGGSLQCFTAGRRTRNRVLRRTGLAALRGVAACLWPADVSRKD